MGRFEFDGQGAFVALSTTVKQGVVARAVTGAGTYTLRADCTGTMVLNSGGQTVHYDIVVDQVGTHIRGLSTDLAIPPPMPAAPTVAPTPAISAPPVFDAHKQFLGG